MSLPWPWYAWLFLIVTVGFIGTIWYLAFRKQKIRRRR